MRVANPDMVVIWSWPAPTAKFFHDANGQNWSPPMGYWLNHLTVDPGYGPIFGNYIKDKAQAVTSFVYPPDASPGDAFWEMLTNQFAGKDLVGLHFRYAMGHHVTQGSLFCLMSSVSAFKQIGANLTRPAFLNFMETHQFDSGAGVILRWPHGDHGMSPYAFNREYIYKWTGNPDGGYDEKRVTTTMQQRIPFTVRLLS